MLQEQVSILVVDDDPRVCDFLREFLEIKGYTVTTASNGIEALLSIQDRRPHLVFLDVIMAGMDGLQTLQRIQQLDRGIRVIMLTGVSDEEIARQTLRDGAYDYLEKPLDPSYLELVILSALAHRGNG